MIVRMEPPPAKHAWRAAVARAECCTTAPEGRPHARRPAAARGSPREVTRRATETPSPGVATAARAGPPQAVSAERSMRGEAAAPRARATPPCRVRPAPGRSKTRRCGPLRLDHRTDRSLLGRFDLRHRNGGE